MALQQRAVLTRARVLGAAADVFAREGYSAASLNEITAEAEATKGALYFHFPGKEALAAAVVHEQAARWPVILESVQQASPNPLVAVVALTYEVGIRMREDAILRAGLRLSSEVRLDAPASFQLLIDAVQELLGEARRQGLLRAGVTPASAARSVVSSFVGVEHIAELQHDDKNVESRLDEFWKIFLSGIAADADWPTMQRLCRRTLATVHKAAAV